MKVSYVNNFHKKLVRTYTFVIDVNTFRLKHFHYLSFRS